MKNKNIGYNLLNLTNGIGLLLLLVAMACGSADSLNQDGDLTYSVTFEGHNNLRLAEGETESMSYKVRLSDKPSSNVTLELNADASQIEVLPARLSFGPADWSKVKTVQITAADDTLIEGDHSAEIEHAISSEDPNYSGQAPGLVNAIISDNDAAGFYIFPSGEITVHEGDSSGVSYSVFLTHEPKSDVVVSLELDASGQVSLSKSELVFSSLAWDEPQQVIVTATDDFAIESNTENQAVISHSIFSADGDFQELADQDLTVKITDNDSVVYVDGRSPVNGDGTSWSTAYNNLQTALSNVYSGQEIWVAADTYIPDTTGDRSQSFVLQDGVSIYGGFAGTETARSQANINTNPTILSGDLNENDHLASYSDNSYRIVVVANLGLSDSLIMSGFIIEGGRADDATFNKGAGIYINNSDIKLNEMEIRGNEADSSGGGVYAIDSWLEVTNSIFKENVSGHSGGGLRSIDALRVRITDSVITSNSTTLQDGGGLSFSHSNTNTGVYMESVTLTNNSSIDAAGAIDLRNADNSIFKDVHFGTEYTLDGSENLLTSNGNQAEGIGGAMYITSLDDIVFEDCSFTGNVSDDRGGALYFSYTTGLEFRSSNPNSFRSHFTYNKTEASGSPAGPGSVDSGSGGAIWHYLGTPDLSLTSIDFTGNHASGTSEAAGGSLYMDGETGADLLTITDSTFTKNKSDGSGGALYLTVLGADISDSNFDSNQSPGNGGAIRSIDNELLKISDSSFDANTGLSGGALEIHHQNATGDGSVVLLDSVFTNNSTTGAGGAIHMIYADNNVMQNVEFGTTYTTDGSGTVLTRDGNTAVGVGGGMYMNNVDGVKFIDTVFKANKSSNRGGGLYFSTCTGIEFISGRPDLFRGSFEYNFTEGSGGSGPETSFSGAGGAIYGYSGPPQMTITNIDFIGNQATSTSTHAAGGAILFNGAVTSNRLQISGSRFEKNTAQDRGGALYLTDAYVSQIIGNQFIENSGEHGGAIQMNNCNTTNIYANEFIENTATGGHGGAIQSFGDDSLEITHSFFYGNHAESYGGVISQDLENAGDTFYIRNSTFVGNTTTAANGGGFLGIDAAVTALIYNSLFYRNESNGVANHIQNDNGTVGQNSNSYFDDGDSHPFVNDSDDPTTFNFRLDPLSPLITNLLDNSNESFIEDEHFKDLDGYQRTIGPGTDRGAYELGNVGVLASPYGSLQVSETGSQASFTVVLTAIPTSDVTMNIISTDLSEVTVEQSSLTFTTSDWDTPQTITVTGVADGVDDYDKSITISIEPITSSDANYNGFDPLNVLVNNVDVD